MSPTADRLESLDRLVDAYFEAHRTLSKGLIAMLVLAVVAFFVTLAVVQGLFASLPVIAIGVGGGVPTVLRQRRRKRVENHSGAAGRS